MIKKITLNGKTIEYDLQRKRVKNINLRIKFDGKVYVSANKIIPQGYIDSFLTSKANFILNAIDYYNNLEKPKLKEYVDGEFFKVFGNNLTLKISVGNKTFVESDNSSIFLTLKDAESYGKRKIIINKWLKNKCEEKVIAKCKEVYPKFKNCVSIFPTIKFRRMTSRWGSCNPTKNLLTFNYALIETPIECIEYVVVHEFTHFLQANHSKTFYQQLEYYMPDWKKRKQLLFLEGRTTK